MLQKWILHLHLLKFSHQNWRLGKGWMSHQITGLITRTTVLLPLDSGLGLPFQQVLGNEQPEQSCLQLPATLTATFQPLQPRAAGRDAQPAPLQCPWLPHASGCALCAETPVSGHPRRNLQLKDSPWKTHLPQQHFTISPPSSKDMFVTRPTAAGHRRAALAHRTDRKPHAVVLQSHGATASFSWQGSIYCG